MVVMVVAVAVAGTHRDGADPHADADVRLGRLTSYDDISNKLQRLRGS
jgi:hypothetical protein